MQIFQPTPRKYTAAKQDHTFCYRRLSTTGEYKCYGQILHDDQQFYAKYLAGLLPDNQPSASDKAEMVAFIPRYYGDKIKPADAETFCVAIFTRGQDTTRI